MAVLWAPHTSKECRDEFWQNKVIKSNSPEFWHLKMKRGTLSTHLAIPISILSEQVQQVWNQTYVYGKFDWQFLGNTYHSRTTAPTCIRSFQHPMPRDKKNTFIIHLYLLLSEQNLVVRFIPRQQWRHGPGAGRRRWEFCNTGAAKWKDRVKYGRQCVCLLM